MLIKQCCCIYSRDLGNSEQGKVCIGELKKPYESFEQGLESPKVAEIETLDAIAVATYTKGWSHVCNYNSCMGLYSTDTVRRSSIKPQVNCYFSLFVAKMIVSICLNPII